MRFTLFLTDRSSLTISTTFVLSALLPLIFTDPAQAESIRTHQCERSGVIRIVELQADNDSGAPCRILYHKPTEKKPTVNLWNAQNDALFCQTNYNAFIEKLEGKLNWACSLENSPQQSLATEAVKTATLDLDLDTNTGTDTDITLLETNGKDKNETKISTDTDRSKPESLLSSRENAPVKSPASDAEQVKHVETSKAPSTTKPQLKPTPLNPIDSSVQKPQPRIAAALPDEQDKQQSDTKLSMAHIKTYIPSGTYTAVGGDSQTENPSACPSSGFFIWNTKSRENPVFEMGPNNAFRFALAPTSGLPTAAGKSSANQAASCDIPVSPGYCEQEQYIGSKPLHPALRNYFACDNRSDKPTIQRPLVLTSTFATADESGNACEISETSRYMALAPSQTVSGDIIRDGEHDLELVILANNARGNSLEQGRGAVCRYVRGGLK